MRSRVCVLLAALLGVALSSACAHAQTKLAPLDPVRIVHLGTVNQASDAGLYVAIDKGYFAEFGLKVELVTFTSAATMIAPLGSGELDVGGGAVSAGLWNADLRKIGVRAVADKGSTRAGWSYFGLVARKDGPVQRCEDLKGKGISNASLSNGVLHAIELWLGKCGLSLADVDVKTLGYPEVVPAKVLVPDLVTAFTCTPAERPCVASKRLAMNSNSAIASRLNRGSPFPTRSVGVTCCPS